MPQGLTCAMTTAQEIAWIAVNESHIAAKRAAHREAVAITANKAEAVEPQDIEFEFDDHSKALFLDDKLFNITNTFDLDGRNLIAPLHSQRMRLR